MKAILRNFSLIAFICLLAMYFPLLHGSEALISAAGNFTIVDGELTEYTGSGGNVTIPGSVTRIGDWAFYDQPSITSVTIPTSVKSIGDCAFSYCTGLTSVKLPNSVTEIGERCFSECSSLKNVTISKSVKKIGEYAFENCESLSSITVESGNTVYSSQNGILFNSNKTTAILCPEAKLGSVTLPSTVTVIDRFAFANCNGITGVTFPSSLKRIEEGAFEFCSSLKTVTLPDTVTFIGENAFEWCSGITSFTMSKSAASIGDYAFSGCYNIKSLTLPTTLKTIGDGIFWGCSGLTQVNIPKSVTSVGWAVFYATNDCTAINVDSANANYCSVNGVLYNKAKTSLIACPGGKTGSLTIPSTVKTIDDYAFGGCFELQSVTLPQSLTSIGSSSFFQCVSIKSITIPASVTSIGNNAFSECGSLTEINYPGTSQQWNKLLINEYGEKVDAGLESTVTIHYNYSPASPVTITTQPVSRTVARGSSVTLSVKASGSSLTYQWYFKKAGQTSFTLWSGRTHAAETVTPNDTWNGIQLYCLVKDAAGNTAKSDTATIKLSNLKITSQPVSSTIKKGSSVTLSVKASGNGLTYQWYFKKAGQTSFTLWSGRTHAAETVTPNDTWDGIQLYCLVKDSAGASLKSSTVTVKFGTPLEISAQPKSKVIQKGSSVTLSVKASGSGLTYQWYFKKAGQTSFTLWSGRTHSSETVTPNDTWDGIQLYCLVKDSSGASLKSSTVTVKFGTPLEITMQPSSRSVTLGSSTTLSLKAQGTGLKYQWYFRKKGQAAYSVWSGHTHASETVTPNDTWDGIQLYCVVTDIVGDTAKSAVITVTLK